MTVAEFLIIGGWIVALFTAGMSLVVATRVQRVAHSLNGRLSELLALTAKSARAEGAEQQRKEDESK